MKIGSARFWYRYYFRYARTGKPRAPAAHHTHPNIHYIALCAKKAAHGYVNLCDDTLKSRHAHTYLPLYRICRINRSTWLRHMMATRPILKLDPRRLP